MQYHSIRKVAEMAGVSIRTLRLYDEMELLKPATRTESRYRMYGEQELLRLQQILFYKELDIPLQEIRAILDSPDFDIVQALERHRAALQARGERLFALLDTIDNTIEHLTNGEYTMTPEELYDGLPKETAEEYHREATQKWGDAVKHSEESLRKMSKLALEALKQESKENWNALFALRHEDPTSDSVQTRIKKHYEVTRKFWGAASWRDKQAPAFKGLGDLFVEDPRYTMMDGQAQPEFGLFLQEAIHYFVETHLEEDMYEA